MKNTFLVTDVGLTVDKVMIMPGSELELNGAAPGHWARFGTSEVKEMTVATPDAKADGKGKKDSGKS